MRDIPAIITLEGEDVSLVNHEFEKVNQTIIKLDKKFKFADERIKFLLQTQADFDNLDTQVESLFAVLKEEKDKNKKLEERIQILEKEAEKNKISNADTTERLEKMEQLSKLMLQQLSMRQGQKKK